MITIRVLGRPAPQGSKRALGRGRMIEMSRHLPAWREAVILAVREARLAAPIAVPCVMSVTYYITKPKRPKFDKYPATPPDMSKLTRATEDALVLGGALVDDALIVRREHEAKVWAANWLPGALIQLWEAE